MAIRHSRSLENNRHIPPLQKVFQNVRRPAGQRVGALDQQFSFAGAVQTLKRKGLAMEHINQWSRVLTIQQLIHFGRFGQNGQGLCVAPPLCQQRTELNQPRGNGGMPAAVLLNREREAPSRY